jgi:hypothetical protein
VKFIETIQEQSFCILGTPKARDSEVIDFLEAILPGVVLPLALNHEVESDSGKSEDEYFGHVPLLGEP